MPKRAQNILHWLPERAQYLLTGAENGEIRSLVVENGEDWLQWLEEHRSFAFHGHNGQINLLKEKRVRGGEGYWYAYRRHGGQTVKQYAGLSIHLSTERLEEIASQLTLEHETSPSPIPVAQFEPLLRPKLQLPRLQKSLILREQLLALLDQGLEHKITLISGPAGYGKTTAVSQWVAERGPLADFPLVASVTLDEGDNDPIRFWRYVITACSTFRPGFGTEALELLLANRRPPFKPLEMMLTSLLNELSLLEEPGILILDDFHAITSPQVNESLSFFLDHLPISLHLMLLIRGEPLFSLTRLRARNELLDIYPPYLAFSLEETRAFLEQELAFTPSAKLLQRIYDRLECWPTGLRLFVRSLQRPTSEQEIEDLLATFAGSHWSIQGYFLNEVLRELPAEQQEFLLQTSVLPRISAPLCDAITGRTDSTRLIASLHGSDLFLIPLDSTDEWARYHSLFAEAMRQEARRLLGDEQLRQIAARASLWYEEHGLLAEAIETTLDAVEASRASSLIEQLLESKQQNSVLAISDLYTLKRWSERLPEEVLENNPVLCLHYAMTLLFLLMEDTHFPGGKERIFHLLEKAELQWRDANNTAKLAEVFAFRSLLARQEGKMLQAVTWAKQSLHWLPQEDRTWRALALTTVGIGEVSDGHINNARSFFLEGQALCELQGNHTYARATRGLLGWMYVEQGELRHAYEQFRQMQNEARAQEDRDDIARTQLAMAQIAYQWNRLDEAEQAVHEALKIGEQMNVEEFQALATARLALVEHARGRTAQAEQRLAAWLTRGQAPISPHSHQLSREVQRIQARIQLAGGNLAAVERWFASIERREEHLPLLQRQREQLLLARLFMARKESAPAIERLESLCTAAAQTGHILFRIESQAVLTLAYFQAGFREKARKQLHELLEMIRSEGYLRLFLDEGEDMLHLLREHLPRLRENVLLTYAHRILSAFAGENGSQTLEALPDMPLLLEPLSPQEQKVLRLLAAGNSNAEIARTLVVSVNTVRSQVQSIFRKLNVNNRVEASVIANQLQLA